MKEQLARLTSLFKDYIKTQAMHPRGPSPVLTQYASRPSPRPFIPTTNHLPHGIGRPNLRQPMPTVPPAFMATSRSVYQPNGSRSKPSRLKIDKDKPRWDPIPITYIELFPKLVEIDHIEPVHLAPFRPPFPRWYNAHTRCDYHAGNPGHSTKNYTALKQKVRDLINDGKLKFEELDGPVGVEDLFEAKAEMIRQEEKAPREAGSRKAAIRRDEVSISKVGRGETEGSSTTESSKERLCELNREKKEQDALPHDTRVGANVEGTKRIFCHP